MKNLFAIISLASLFACSQPHHSHVKQHVGAQNVKCYRQHTTGTDGSNAFVYWYVIMAMNNHGCYYYSSVSPISDYSVISWQESETNPIDNLNAIDYEPLADVSVEYQDMSVEMQQEMDLNAEYFGGMTQEEMGDYEGGETDNGTEGGSESSDAGSDGGSSDGGGDSGGGDGGGGDGGGGE